MKERNLECSSRGDKRFSAFYAKVVVNGNVDSIENHYQQSKRFNGFALSTKEAKGKMPTSFVVGEKEFPVEHLSDWYYLLWVKYFQVQPALLKFAREHETFSDIFRGKSINCQADAIRDIAKNGIQAELNKRKVFLELLKN